MIEANARRCLQSGLRFGLRHVLAFADVDTRAGLRGVRPLLKLREAKAGKAPERANYRLVINFKSEEDRLNWVKTDIHQKVWPTIEGTFKVKSYTAILYDQL